MSVLTTFAGSAGVPPGNSINYQKTSCTAATETTILNVAQACLVKEILVAPVTSGSNVVLTVTSFKTNINGGGDVTKFSSFNIATGNANVAANGGGTAPVYSTPIAIPCEIDASTSCVLKITLNITTDVLVRYYLK